MCVWCFLYGHLIVACFYPHPFLCLSNSPLHGTFVRRAACEEEEQIMLSTIFLGVVVIEKGIQESTKLTDKLMHIMYSCEPQGEWAAGPG